MIIDELNKKIADIESLANDKTSTIESKVSDLTDGLLMVADAVDIIPEMVDEKITAITKEFSAIKDTVSKVKAKKGDKGDRGEPGIDGIGIKGDDGKDGSPDTGEQIVDKINELEGVLDTKVLKDFTMPDVKDLERQINTIGNQTLRLLSRPTTTTSSSFTGVTTDATLTGLGTDASPLSVVATSASDVAVTVRAATTAALAGSPTYDNGISGVGATLTRGTNGILPNQDGRTLQVADRLLVKNQSSTLQNGVYEVTSLGSVSTPWVLTRTTDADTTSQLDELVVTVSEGSTNRGTVWGQQTNNPVVGTSAITFATVVSTAVTQATSGTQAIYQIPTLTGTARQITRGTANFKYNPTNDLFTIRGIDYTFPANNGDASQVLTTDGAGTLSWAATGGGGTPAGSDTQIQYNNAGAFGASSDLTFDPATSTLKAVTDNPPFRSTIKFFSNGGTDDLTASLATAFTGTPPTTFIVLAYGNIQIVDYINLVGGNFSQGDTITGSVSGAEGYVAYDDGVGQFYVSITNSIQFAATDVIDNANGVTADYDTSTTSDDIFFWLSTNGGSGGPIVITGTAQTLNDGIDITFGSTTGHGAEDSWEWSYKTLKNTWLTNNQAEGAVSGYVNGSVYDNGSNNIVAINGLVQNGDDDRIFPLSFYQDLTSGNNSDKERAYYGLDIFKGDPAEPLEFIVYTRKGIGLGPSDITEFKVSSQNGINLETDKLVTIGSPIFNVSDQTFSWVGGTNSTGITIDDVNEHITISNLPAYDDDTAAGVGGLTAGMVYMTTGSGSAPLNAAGILMIKQ